MSYIDQIILPDEKVIYTGKVSNSVYFWPVFWTLATFLAGTPVTLVWLIFAFLYQINSEFVITDKRLIAKYGTFSRTSIEQRLNKIDSILVKQGLLGSMFNYGRIIVMGTGVSQSPFGPIARPLEFKRAIEQAIDNQEKQVKGAA